MFLQVVVIWFRLPPFVIPSPAAIPGQRPSPGVDALAHGFPGFGVFVESNPGPVVQLLNAVDVIHAFKGRQVLEILPAVLLSTFPCQTFANDVICSQREARAAAEAEA